MHSNFLKRIRLRLEISNERKDYRVDCKERRKKGDRVFMPAGSCLSTARLTMQSSSSLGCPLCQPRPLPLPRVPAPGTPGSPPRTPRPRPNVPLALIPLPLPRRITPLPRTPTMGAVYSSAGARSSLSVGVRDLLPPTGDLPASRVELAAPVGDGDRAQPTGDLARVIGDFARVIGDFARVIGDFARVIGDFWRTIGDRAPATGDRAPLDSLDCDLDSTLRASCLGGNLDSGEGDRTRLRSSARYPATDGGGLLPRGSNPE